MAIDFVAFVCCNARVPARQSAPTAVPRSYAELKRSVEEALLAGQRRVEQAKVRTYWETGRLIDAHLLLFKERAAYGAEVIPKLERDLEVSERVLYYCLKFVRLYPILPTWAELTWGHYRALTHVENPAQRKMLTLVAVKQRLSCRELEDRVSAALALANRSSDNGKENGSAIQSNRPKLLTAKYGTPGLFPVVTRRGGLALDLGFKMYRPIDSAQGGPLRGFRAGDIVRVEPDGRFVRDETATKADLFTYRTLDVRVVDGDTLAVTIALPPHNEIDKKLRLRGLNCPEMDTAAGKAAKRFAQQLVDAAAFLILTTTKPDKYDRYVADVFLTTDSGEEVFLNNALLENGHADRMDANAPPPELL